MSSTTAQFKTPKSERNCTALLKECADREDELSAMLPDFDNIVNAIDYGLSRVRTDLRDWMVWQTTCWHNYETFGRDLPSSTKRSRVEVLEQLGLLEVRSDSGGARTFVRVTDAGHAHLKEQE